MTLPNPYEEQYQEELKRRRDSAPPSIRMLSPEGAGETILGVSPVPSPNPYEARYQEALAGRQAPVLVPPPVSAPLAPPATTRKRRFVPFLGDLGQRLGRGAELAAFGSGGKEPFLATSAAYQRNIVEPLGTLATAVATPGFEIPGITHAGGFEFRPEQLPGREGYRKAYRGNIPLGGRILTEAVVDPLNLAPGIGFTRVSQLRRAAQLLRGARTAPEVAAARAAVVEAAPDAARAASVGDLSNEDFTAWAERLAEAEGNLPGGVATRLDIPDEARFRATLGGPMREQEVDYFTSEFRRLMGRDPTNMDIAQQALDNARVELEAAKVPGAPAPKFGTRERAEFDAARKQRVFAGERVTTKRQEVAEARDKVARAQQHLDGLTAQAESQPEQIGRIQAGMGIGEPPPQGGLPLGGQEGISRPLIDADQVAEQQRLAAERAAGQQALPVGPSAEPASSLADRPAGLILQQARVFNDLRRSPGEVRYIGSVKQFPEIVERAGYTNSLKYADIQEFTKAVGDFSLRVEDTNGNLGIMNASDFLALTQDAAFSDRIKRVGVSSTQTLVDGIYIDKGFMSLLRSGEATPQGIGQAAITERLRPLGDVALHNLSTVLPLQREKFVAMAVNDQFRRGVLEFGIKEVRIEPPYRFGLSEQGNLDPRTGILSINADADDPLHTALHELGHRKFDRLPKEQQEAYLTNIRSSTEPSIQGYLKGRDFEEAVADVLVRKPEVIPGIESSLQISTSAPVTREIAGTSTGAAPPSGPPHQPPGVSVSGGATPPPRPPAADLILGIPGEKPEDAAVRKYAGGRSAAGLETQRWIEQGDDLLRAAGVTKEFAGRPVVSRELGHQLLLAMHGEGPIPVGFEAVIADLKTKMAQETGEMVAADPSFSKRMLPGPDYFPRMWKMPKETPKGRAQLGRKPFFFKQRADASYGELREAGYEPASNNPYDMLALRRVAGTDYRDGLLIVARLKKAGKALPLDEVPVLEKANWRVPEVGPAFEGRPFPTKEGAAAMTQPIAVPRNIAGTLETMFGKRPTLEVAGKNIVPMIGRVSQGAKRAKLIASAFQHLDFLIRAAAEALSPTALMNGTTVNFPQFLARAAKGQFSEASRRATRERLLSTAPILKGSDISMRMLVEEGMEVGGDTSVIRRSVRSFLDDIDSEAPTGLTDRIRSRIDGVNRFFERGLFENIYPLASEWAARNHVVLVLKSIHPEWTSRQIAGQAAKDINVMFSNLGDWQTVFSQPAMREFTRALIFSTNESESWIRSALSTVRGPSKRLWLEHWVGLGILLAGVANFLHRGVTGEWLPPDRYIPTVKSPYGPFPIGYNPKFLAPDIPLKDHNGENITLDLMGQADTVFRFALDPPGAVQSRENVVPRAVATQVTGRSFGGRQVTGAKQRAVSLGLELAAPIGAGEVIQAARDKSGVLERVVPGSEVKLGARGHAVQAVGVNLRSPRSDLELLQTYQEGIGHLLEGQDREVWGRYSKVSGRMRGEWLKRQPLAIQATVKRIAGQEDRYRSELRKNNPMLDVLLVERGSNAPVTSEGRERLAELQREKLGGGTTPFRPFAPSGVGATPGLLGR